MNKIRRSLKNKKESKLAIVGLGYVGLPLAIEFGKKRDVIGFDINKQRIIQLKNAIDTSLEVSKKDFKLSKYLKFTNKINNAR